MLCRSVEEDSEMVCENELASLVGVQFNALLQIIHIFSSSLFPACANVKSLAVVFLCFCVLFYLLLNVPSSDLCF